MTYPLPNRNHEVVSDIEQLAQTITQIDTDISNLEAKTAITSESVGDAEDTIIHSDQIINGEITNIAPNRFLIVNNDGNGFTCVDGGGTSGGKIGQCTIKRSDENYDTIYGDIWNVSRNGITPQTNNEIGKANELEIFCDESEIENEEQQPKVNPKTIQATQDFEVESNSSIIFKDTLEETNEPIELATNQNYGLIKVGTGIDVSNGTISADIITPADQNQLGYVKVGKGIEVEDGVIFVAEIDAATNSTKGVIKIGEDFEINSNGEMELKDMTDASIIYKLDQIKNCENGNIDLEEQKLIYRATITSDIVIQINENFVPTQDYTFILELISDGTHLIAFSDQFKDGMAELPINRGVTRLKISKKLGLPYYEATIYQHSASEAVNLTPIGSELINSEFTITSPQGGNWNPKQLLRTALNGYSDVRELQFDFETLVCIDYVNYISPSSTEVMSEFILKGSNDGKNWTTLLYRNGEVVYGKVYTEVKGCFRHYNLKIGYTSNNNKPGGVTLWGTQIDNNESELTLLTPLMSSNITSFATFTSSKFVSNSAAQVTDTDLATFVIVGYDANQNRWAQYELETPAAANVLKLDFYNYNSQTNWFTLTGSNNGENWTLLLERQYPTNTLFNNNYRVMIYNFQNETAYKYYRLNCIATNDTKEDWHIFGFKLYRRSIGKHNIYNLVPKLSSNSQDGYEVTASSCYNSDHKPFYVFDNNASTKWGTKAPENNNPEWLQINLPTANICNVVTISARPEGDNIYKETPTEFDIQGSNDGESWDTLTSQTGVTWTSNGQTQSFSFENETAYLYYRILMKNNTYIASGTNKPYSFGEIAFINRVREYKRYLDKYDYLVPKMSSNSQNGYIASANNESYGQKLYAAFEAFNREISDRSSWGTTVKPAWLQIELSEAKKANVLKVSGAFSGEEPTTFTLYGSNDGTNWRSLLSSGVLTWTHNETKTWELEGTTAYKYYRLGDIVNTRNSWVDIAEFQLIYKDLIQEY